MKQYLRCLAAGSLLLALSAGHPAWAQKRGGILRLASSASPANTHTASNDPMPGTTGLAKPV